MVFFSASANTHQWSTWFQKECCLSLQGRLNELMSQIRMQNHFGAVRSEERYNVDADLLREIKQVSRLYLCDSVIP